jgi:hypothetical protein
MVTQPTPPAGVREPIPDEGGPAVSPIVLTANTSVTGVVVVSAIEFTVSRLNPPVSKEGKGWVLAGVLMLGLGFRRRKARWPAHLLLAVGVLIGLTGIGACGGSPITLTPGTYPYTITASSINSSSSLSASTTVMVTVPPGIVVQQIKGPGPV